MVPAATGRGFPPAKFLTNPLNIYMMEVSTGGETVVEIYFWEQPMIHEILSRFELEEASAHCDIPCGIYDPHLAQVAALTVIRMVDLMTDLMKDHQPSPDFFNSMARYVLVKEEHAELAKREVRVIFGDYFKKEHVDKWPELPALVHKIMQAGSKARQTASREHALALLDLVNQFAAIYWASKGIETKKVKAPYKPGEEIVYPIL
jgi:nickel superoxide dismutase